MKNDRILKKIICAICLTFLGSTFVYAYNAESPIVEELAKSTSSWDGSILPEYQKGRPEITILKITIPPKTELPFHRHPGINAGVLLEGALTVVTEDGKTLNLKEGDSILEVVNTRHY